MREAIASRPMQVFVRCADARALAAWLIGWACVQSVSFGVDAKILTAEVTDMGDFRLRLGDLMAERELGLDILNPLDDNLSAVFSYLVA